MIVSFISGKGGVGKSTLATFYTDILLERGKDHIEAFLDLDWSKANSQYYFNINPSMILPENILPVTDLMDYVNRFECDKNRKVYLDYIYTGQGTDTIFPSVDSVKVLKGKIEALKSTYANVILDNVASLTIQAVYPTLASDIAVIVMSPDITSISDGYLLANSLLEKKYQGRIAIILNSFRSFSQGLTVFKRVFNALKIKGHEAQLLGVVPYSYNIVKGFRERKKLSAIKCRSVKVIREAFKMLEAT